MLVRTCIPIAVVMLALVAGCDGSITPCPTCTDVGVPKVSCPADIAIAGVPAAGQSVTYASPVETGGTPPVTTTCVPASGSAFPVGTTTVQCTARDASNRSAVCPFNVTLTSSQLGAMHFLAFGDSTTAGENGIDPPPAGSGFSETYTPPPCGTSSLESAARAFEMGQARPQYFDPAISYPQQLLNLLKARFPGETFTMENEGNPGETAAAGNSGLTVSCLPVDHPTVMLLLEGINDIAGSATAYKPTPDEQQTIVNKYLQGDVSTAISSGVAFVFVSTILPVANCAPEAPSCRGADPSVPTMLGTANGSIDQVNARIKATIGGATIVDGNAAFKADDPTFATLIEEDGLHPSQHGYAVLAQAWMNAIVTHIPITSLRRRR